MIGKIMKNASFRKTLQYVSSKPGAAMIGGNTAATDLSGLIREFSASKDLRPDVKHPVYHISLSLSYEDLLDNDQFAAIASRYVAGLLLSSEEPQVLDDESHLAERLEEFSEDQLFHYPYSVFRHSDRLHDHVHIVLSRINFVSGEIVSDSFDRYRSQRLIRILEHEHGLVQVPSSWENRGGADTAIVSDAYTGKQCAEKQCAEKQCAERSERLQVLLPGVLALWQYLDSRRASFVDGKKYRLLVRRLKGDSTSFSVYRKENSQDGQGLPQKELLPVLTLTRTNGVAEFDLSDSQIDDQDFESLSSICEQALRIQQEQQNRRLGLGLDLGI